MGTKLINSTAILMGTIPGYEANRVIRAASSGASAGSCTEAFISRSPDTVSVIRREHEQPHHIHEMPVEHAADTTRRRRGLK